MIRRPTVTLQSLSLAHRTYGNVWENLGNASTDATSIST
jgi:hypothetical protein